MKSPTLSKALPESLSALLHEKFFTSPQHARRHLTAALRSETYFQLQLLNQLLCQRPATPLLAPELSCAIDAILVHQRNNKILTSATSIPPRFEIERQSNSSDADRAPIKLSLWRGDITTLTDVSAIVNAANSELLGCFQPSHKCIDNIIHSAAGPELRQEMGRVMTAQNHLEPVGCAKVSSGFNLPASHIIHTVGPSIRNKSQPPSDEEKGQLENCYIACLDALESLPLDANGHLSIAFCCISTGLFAFPKELAAGIALRSVVQWCKTHPNTPVTHIIFDVFEEGDLDLYAKEFDRLAPNTASDVLGENNLLKSVAAFHAPTSVSVAKQWIKDADYLIISSGAGLSASDGLDYTSTALFARHHHGLLEHGLKKMYDTIGLKSWPSACHKWGYFFTHANLILHWPKSDLYASLYSLASEFGPENYFARTSNVDGLFAANNFPQGKISTPQGQYRYLQCYAKCRPDAVFPFSDFLEKTLPFIDPKTQALTDKSMIPHCGFCGTELTMCVRGGSYFNEAPFEAQESAWYDFLEEIENSESGKNAVILELGVGLNTPSVLRWPNENLVEHGNGKFKLVRVGLGPSACVPFDLAEAGGAVVIDGDVGSALVLLDI